MYAENFEYDGSCLSDFGCIIVDFNGSDTFTTTEYGSQIQFELKPAKKGEYYYNVGYSYTGTAIPPKIGIAKDPDVFSGDERVFTDDEIRRIIRWLHRPTLNKFRILYDEEDRIPCYFNASFNVNFVRLRERTVGLELDVITDSAYGYGDEVKLNYSWTANKTIGVPLYSDIVCKCYPEVEITISGSGDFVLENELTGTYVQIKNCTSGEKIKFHGESCIITTDKTSHNLAKDFNFDYPRLANYYDTYINNITINMACDVTFKYKPNVANLP